MEYHHIQQLTEDFGSQDSLDYKFEILTEIAEYFHIEYNEDLKRNLEENLLNKLKTLISEFKDKLEKLEHIFASVR